tara:strand:+ start:369 stop:689 length:321 start_codon:yes stop_codon:yes gene_type:complete
MPNKIVALANPHGAFSLELSNNYTLNSFFHHRFLPWVSYARALIVGNRSRLPIQRSVNLCFNESGVQWLRLHQKQEDSANLNQRTPGWRVELKILGAHAGSDDGQS